MPHEGSVGSWTEQHTVEDHSAICAVDVAEAMIETQRVDIPNLVCMGSGQVASST